MTDATGNESQGLLDHVLLPVANEEDAWATAMKLEPHQPEHVTALHVVEKGGVVSRIRHLSNTPRSVPELLYPPKFGV